MGRPPARARRPRPPRFAMARLVRRMFPRLCATFRPARHPRHAAGLRARLRLQPLEGRVVPATITVTNANDAGAGSLRQAILDANASVGTADTIVFDPTL